MADASTATASNSLRTFMQGIVTDSNNCNNANGSITTTISSRQENYYTNTVMHPTVVTIVVDNASLPSSTLLQTLQQSQLEERRKNHRIVINPLVLHEEEGEAEGGDENPQSREMDEFCYNTTGRRVQQEQQHSITQNKEDEEEPIEAEALEFVSPPTCRRLLSQQQQQQQQRCFTCKKKYYFHPNSLDSTAECRCHGRSGGDRSLIPIVVYEHQQSLDDEIVRTPKSSSEQQQQKQQGEDILQNVPVTPLATSTQDMTDNSENSNSLLKQESNNEKASSPRSIMDMSMF